MGGKAFGKLLTPRMPPHIYKDTRDDLLILLRKHFLLAASPTQGPEKTDFGDIDILVCGPIDSNMTLPETGSPNIFALAGILNAKDWKEMKGNPTMHFAIPWPQTPSTNLPSNELSTTEYTEHDQLKDYRPDSAIELSLGIQDRYIQVDVTMCETCKMFHWERFIQAHGDLLMILGQMIRKYGLTINNKGFHLRIEELESWNKEKSRVLMTANPEDVMRFLGVRPHSK